LGTAPERAAAPARLRTGDALGVLADLAGAAAGSVVNDVAKTILADAACSTWGVVWFGPALADLLVAPLTAAALFLALLGVRRHHGEAEEPHDRASEA
jgi:hypothetical protein